MIMADGKELQKPSFQKSKGLHLADHGSTEDSKSNTSKSKEKVANIAG